MSNGEAAKPWLQWYPREVPANLTYPEEPLYALLEYAADQYGERTATIFFGARLTYRQLREEARRLAAGLIRLGLRKGDRVAVMMANCPQAVIAYFGVLMAGGVVVMVNPLYTERELRYQLDDSGARILIGLDLVYPKVKGLGLEHLILTEMPAYMSIPTRWIAPLKLKPPKVAWGAGVQRWAEVLDVKPLPAPIPVDPSEDLALLQYTGATTGKPKGCMLTHRNLMANVYQIGAWLYQRSPADPVRVLVGLPIFHVYGMTTAMNFAIHMAGEMTLQPRFEPREALKLIQKYKVQIFPGAPTMYVGINHVPGVEKMDLSSIDACISGAAPLPLEVQQTFERLTHGRLCEGYGLSEASPVTHANPVWATRKEGSIGLPWPDTDVRIIDSETGQDVAPGEVGEMLVRGPQVMKGYWNNPEATAGALRDGWLYTGDMARMDEDGFFYIADRKKDLIIAGGLNIYPREVEDVLFMHPAVKQAAVIGVPDEYRGESVKAFIVLKEPPFGDKGVAATQAELDQHCRANLASYKIPRHYEFREALPMTLVGKVLRRVLVEEEAAKRKAMQGVS
ncbi:MAG TPA: long-chain fatty acid--CoA ligase [Symbiobacteriaceae bacterium]|nr:long-chain fatty acid--CoA ligase [Symbiobacteriaceae bacterium]